MTLEPKIELAGVCIGELRTDLHERLGPPQDSFQRGGEDSATTDIWLDDVYVTYSERDSTVAHVEVAASTETYVKGIRVNGVSLDDLEPQLIENGLLLEMNERDASMGRIVGWVLLYIEDGVVASTGIGH